MMHLLDVHVAAASFSAVYDVNTHFLSVFLCLIYEYLRMGPEYIETKRLFHSNVRNFVKLL